jgi:hypothetical protein
MRKIMWNRPVSAEDPEGGLSITTPARNTFGDEGKTDEELEQRAWDKLPPDAINPVWIEESDVPVDRTFRNALENVGGKPVHSLTKAKNIAHFERRLKRDVDMKPYDDIISKQIPGQDAAAAEAERVKIRNADAAKQTRIDNATTIAQLKSEMPTTPTET